MIKKETHNLRIENVTEESLKSISEEALYSLRLRFVQLWLKEFRAGKKEAHLAGLTRLDFLVRYKAVVNEFKQRNMVIKRRASIDWALFRKAMLGVEVSAMSDVVLVSDYVAVSGGFVKNPNSSKEIDVVIKDETLKSEIANKLQKSFKSQLSLPLKYFCQPSGPQSAYIPIYDLVLRAKNKGVKVERPNALDTDEVFKYYHELDKWDSQRIIVGASVMKAIAGFNPKSILDVGCGSGRLMKVLKETESYEISGIDNNILAVQVTKSKDLEASLGFMKKLKFDDGQFDVAVSVNTLELSNDIPQAVKEMRRVSKRGVVAIIDSESKEKVKKSFGDSAQFELLFGCKSILIVEKKEDIEKKKENVKDQRAKFKQIKKNAMLHIISGVVYAPGEMDSDGEYATQEALTEAMHSFMENRSVIKLEHGEVIECVVLESFQADEDTEKEGGIIPKGGWWLSLRVKDDDIWDKILDGELVGFSFGGRATS